MKYFKLLSGSVFFLTAMSILFSGCSSTTMIQSLPADARIYIDDEFVGTTPYYYSDTKIVGSRTYISIEKEGFEAFNTVLTRDEEVDPGAIVGGVLFTFPFLWTMKYKPVHQYELIPVQYETYFDDAEYSDIYYQELRKLKLLLDDGIITREEFDKEKAKILERK